jgi:D-alanyl-D-alanine dipeptidase
MITKTTHARPACWPRRKFATELAARAALMRIHQQQGVVRRYVEPCSKCNGWHLS